MAKAVPLPTLNPGCLSAKCQLFSINTLVPVQLFNRHVQMKPNLHIGVLIFSHLIFSNPQFLTTTYLFTTFATVYQKSILKNLSINIHVTLKCLNKKQNVISHKIEVYSHNPKDKCGKETQTHVHKSVLTAVICKSLHSEIFLFMIVYRTKHFLWDVPMVHM